MQKKNIFLFWFGVILGIGTVSAAVLFTFSSTLNSTAPLSNNGFFYTNGSGNAGIVTQNFTLNGTVLAGTIDLQSVGIGATFNAGAEIVPPVSGKVTDLWTLTGTMTSTNAGTIYLSGPNTNLCYDPVSHQFQGYGWNNGIGNVPFGNGNCSGVATTGTGYQGRVKIIGSAGGNTIFSSLFTQDSPFNTSVFNNSLQKVRQSVALLSRNLKTTQKNTSFNLATPVFVGDKVFFINDTNSTQTLTLSNANLFTSVRSIIVVGGDVVIDNDILPASFNTSPKAIIVIKNNSGIGGQVYVKQNVKRIQSTVFAEGTVFSGDNSANIYNATSASITSLPFNQIWVQGSLLSRNTIGGCQQGAPICPLPGASCNYETSIRYDLNFFRSIQAAGQDISTRAYKDNTLDNYTVIIEYDSRVLSDAPPGLTL